ncbi:hypothetical protein JTE90_023585 [Oedothorax gibbosus]|uniref:Uncharacterized protein n=1 Tax=Oedothorax gibbosus TaxID=931172 RepID=A0AAV6TIZ6_9ARAC|nr:hypothetical protein JTE90_023585 [Oedothorax gibbosus]
MAIVLLSKQPTPFPWGLMSVSHRTPLTGRLFIPPAASLLYQKWQLGTLILSRPAFSHARRTFHHIKSYAARPRSDDRLARQNRYGPQPEFPLPRPSGHSSPLSRSQRVRSNSALPQVERGGLRCAHAARETGIRECGDRRRLYFISPAGLIKTH